MKCAYCGQVAKGTKEHIISSGVLDLFPECYITYDDFRKTVYEADPMIKDVCADCNNNKIAYIDSYARNFIGRYFTSKYNEEDLVEIEYDYTMIQKMLLKYAFNDMRSRKEDCAFFDREMLDYLLDENNIVPKENITVLCGIAVNVSPVPEAMFGNLKIRWCRNPNFFSDSVIRNINYETGQISWNADVEKQKFPDLEISYIFKFNSVQFLLMCWKKNSDKIRQNNTVLEYQYPYYLMKANDEKTVLPICTDEVNYHQFTDIHVRWDGLQEVGLMRKYANGGKYIHKENIEKEWLEEEKKFREEHPR